MTALTANRPTEFLEIGGRRWRTFGVAADVVIYAGALVAINASGYLVPTSAASQKVVGIACTELDTTGLANGAKQMEVDHGIAHLENSGGGQALTAANIEDLCYAADDQTVAKADGGTSQVTRGDVVFNGTDEVGLTVDGLTISVPSNTSDDQTATDLRDKWNAHPVAKGIATATIDLSGAESYIILTFKDRAAHTVVAYSPATADVTGITNTTAAVAATNPVAGRVHSVSNSGVYVRLCMG